MLKKVRKKILDVNGVYSGLRHLFHPSFVEIRSVILLTNQPTNKQTDKQTDAGENNLLG